MDTGLQGERKASRYVVSLTFAVRTDKPRQTFCASITTSLSHSSTNITNLSTHETVCEKGPDDISRLLEYTQ